MAEDTATIESSAPEATATPPGTDNTPSASPSDWRASFSDAELKASKSLARYDAPEKLARAYVDLEKRMGAPRGGTPKPEDPPEAWDRWAAERGRPAKVDEYGSMKPAALPEGMSWDADGERSFLNEVAWKRGFSADDVKAISAWYEKHTLGQATQLRQQEREAYKQTTEILTQLWGPMGSRAFQGQHAVARAAARELVNGTRNETLQKELAEFIEGEADYDPLILYVLNRYGNELMEDKALPRELSMGITPEEADANLAALYKDPAWRNGRDPRHKEVLRQIDAMTRIKLGKNNRNLDVEP